MSLSTEALEVMLAAGVDQDVALVALAAIAGPEELDQVVAGGAAERLASPEADTGVVAPAAYLASIEVTGFRGIGPTATIELTPGPGLTVVSGRNGSGKSSFAEALEVILTGESWRWKNKSAEWKQGWRNLHHTEQATARATFSVEGSRGHTSIWREWGEDDRLAESGATVVQAHGGKETDLAGYGWAGAVELYRPLLSHAELSVVADNPSSLFDALSGVLGVDELADAADLLRKRRLELQSSLKAAKTELKAIATMLTESEDPRAETAATALAGRVWDLDAIEGPTVSSAPDETSESLRRWAQLTAPDKTVVEALIDQLRAAGDAVNTLEKTEAGRAARVGSLLALALQEHSAHGDIDCPVCGKGQLDQSWQKEATRQVAELEAVAEEYKTATATLTRVVREAQGLVALNLPEDVAELNAGPLRSAVQKWADLPGEPKAIADQLAKLHPTITKEAAEVAKTATALLREREDKWQPIGLALGRWAELARRGLSDDLAAGRLKKAEDALSAATLEIRSRRFAPIAEQAIQLWGDLRLQSNVQLHDVELTGKGNRRRVDLNVTVDGAEGAALGVVSQGEVNCLALSLFFPRAMLPESPFRFIVIDDPVQAMDPARVDGLARVFAEVAKTRQLIVFTHDDRLPDSLRRLALAHTLLQVTRRPNSEVKVTPRLDPVLQYFLDARAVAKDEEAPDGVASRVVPGFCRSGIEAACMEAVRRRRLGRGESHEDVERLLFDSKATTGLAALTLFDDPSAGGKVLGELNRKWGKTAADAFNDSKRGAHQGFSGSLEALIGECQRVAEGLRSAK